MRARSGAILREMGLAPIWRLRITNAQDFEHESATLPASEAEVPEAAATAVASATTIHAGPTQEGPRAIAQLLTAVEATSTPRPSAPSATADKPLPLVEDGDRVARIAGLDWEALEADIRECRSCGLCERRIQAVPGVGDRRAKWLFVGEGPGSEEDQRGEPFVGPAGQLLDAMLAAIGLQRGDGVYIANAVKCRPPHNRTPAPEEIATCWPYLARQIELLQPSIVVALGRPAAQALLKNEVRIGAARKQVFHHAGTPVVVTYHPAYLLRNPADKAKTWEDLCFARRVMAEPNNA